MDGFEYHREFSASFATETSDKVDQKKMRKYEDNRTYKEKKDSQAYNRGLRSLLKKVTEFENKTGIKSLLMLQNDEKREMSLYSSRGDAREMLHFYAVCNSNDPPYIEKVLSIDDMKPRKRKSTQPGQGGETSEVTTESAAKVVMHSSVATSYEPDIEQQTNSILPSTQTIRRIDGTIRDICGQEEQPTPAKISTAVGGTVRNFNCRVQSTSGFKLVRVTLPKKPAISDLPIYSLQLPEDATPNCVTSAWSESSPMHTVTKNIESPIISTETTPPERVSKTVSQKKGTKYEVTRPSIPRKTKLIRQKPE